jgi:glutathione peroxidase
VKRSTARCLTILTALAVSADAACTGKEIGGKRAGMPSRSVYDFTMKTIDGEDASLSMYSGKTLLIVNTASECGYTPQYRSLQALYDRYKDRGFEVLAFPSNDFGQQEPGTNAEIKAFCSTRFHTTFPLFEKISVKGEDRHALFRHLTTESGFDGEIKWNFSKFLVDPNGRVVARYSPDTDPLSKELVGKLESVLSAE